MATYPELIRQDVHLHEPCEDVSLWPTQVSEFVQFLKNKLKIPKWLKSGAIPWTNKRAIDLLHQLRASDDTSSVALWDSTDEIIDKEIEQRLHVVFSGALVDCARIRSVVETEYLTNIPCPKESFLVLLLRDVILDAYPRLSTLEDVPVVLPRHFSGEPIQILHYVTKSICATSVISICQEMPVEETVSTVKHQSGDEGNDSSSESDPFKHSPPTMSEFMDACERPKTPEEVEEEPEDNVLPPQFDANFIAFSPSTTPPSGCYIPVLCMAEEEELPVLMSSLLYQRRVWHISDPLVGLEFLKYDTVVRLFVGWIEDEISADRVLPRVHLLEIETPVALDLSSPSVALALSRLLVSLEPHISGIRDAAELSVDAVISETQAHSLLSWRIDTDALDEETSSVGSESVREMVLQWAENQSYAGKEE